MRIQYRYFGETIHHMTPDQDNWEAMEKWIENNVDADRPMVVVSVHGEAIPLTNEDRRRRRMRQQEAQ